MLRGGKGTNWEGGHRVPFIAHWPGKVPAGTVCRELVTAMDILPTLAAITGAKLPTKPIDGHDVTDLLTGVEGAKSPTETFIYYHRDGELAGVRRGPWKLMLEENELFHLERDPSEQLNVREDHRELVIELHDLAAKLDAEMTAGVRPPLVVDQTVFDPKR